MAGRPAFAPTDEQRKQVEVMSGYGVPEDGIALSIGISAPTLRKYFRHELDLGIVKANSQVAQSLFKKAIGDGASSTTAAIFWAKTRMGWKETVVNEHSGSVEVTDARERLARIVAGQVAADEAGAGAGKPH
jgi:hypothetical protein